jgi:hypothetical protein
VGRADRRCPAFLRFCVSALLGLALSLTVAPRASADEVIDRVLAVVSGDVITLSDVRIAIALGRVDVEGAADPVGAALAQLIDRALILDEVNRFAPPEPSAAAVDAAYAALAMHVGAGTSLGAVMTRQGISEASVRELLHEDLRMRAYLDQRFTTDNPQQQRALVADWVAGLRRRADITDLYVPAPTAPPTGTAAPARG